MEKQYKYNDEQVQFEEIDDATHRRISLMIIRSIVVGLTILALVKISNIQQTTEFKNKVYQKKADSAIIYLIKKNDKVR